MTGVDQLIGLASSDPATAYERATAFLRRTDASEKYVILALRAAGLSAKELGHLEDGIGHLKEALARAKGYDAALVRMNLVGLLSARGDAQGALAEAARAEGVLRGGDADRLAANIACALARAGRLSEADAVASRALPRLRLDHDPVTLSGLLTNLGLARALRGDLDTAEAALMEAVAVGEAAGLGHVAAMAKGNLAFVASRRGDVPRALRLFAAAEPALTQERVAQCRFDVAETLIQAGLPGEARPLLTKTLESVAANGYRCDIADGLLLLAHAELADGDPERAAETAERARATFADQERTGWTLLADHLLIRARWAAGDRSPVFLRSAVATAERLEVRGWAEASAETRIIAARVALALHRPAGHLLEPVSRALDHGRAALRAAAWHAVALERWARHDRDGARAAITAGLCVVEEHAEVFGALELRARAAGLGDELAQLGLCAARTPRELLSVEERRRALARPASLRPPRDQAQAAALTELRALSARRASVLAQDGIPEASLSERLTQLETSIRRRHQSKAHLPGLDLFSALEDRALVEFLRIGDELHAVTVHKGRIQRHRLGPYERAVELVRVVRFTLKRLVEQGEDLQTNDGLAAACKRLDDLLQLADGDLVLAPTGALHGLPWAALPSLKGRPYVVVPSAAAWLQARASESTRKGVVLVAGPDLENAEREVNALRALLPQAVTYTGATATAECVRDALEGTDVAHLASHGEFRDGNALFSCLRLADGPLMLCDLETLAEPPRLLVLSSCDLGRAGDGDAVIGMAGVLLALGTATVIASVTPVRDAEAPEFMTAFHQVLAAGAAPAQALAAVPRVPGTAGFNCFGAG